MEPKKPMLWTRVDQETADEAQRLADEYYDGNISMLVRQAVKRFIPVLRAMPSVAEIDADDVTAVPA